MKQRLTIFLILLGCFIPFLQWGTAEPDDDLHLLEPLTSKSELRFISNDGQWDERIAYQVRLNGGRILLEKNAFVYDLMHFPLQGHDHGRRKGYGRHYASPLAIKDQFRGHVVRMQFEGANPDPVIQASARFAEYHNYFIGNDTANWRGGVPLYGTLTYQNLYPGIDLRVYGHAEGLKYDFVVQPGADPAQIQIRYEGMDKIRLEDGALKIRTSVRDLTEEAPYVFQVQGEQRVEVPSAFHLRKKRLTYEFPKGYDPSRPLVIDPSLVFSTYSGSTADNWGFTATFDTAGNAYAGGIEFSGGGGYPTTLGTYTGYQTNTAGGQREVTISKFSPDGTGLIYATYLGGNVDDQPHSLIVDGNDNLIISGRTNSPNFPTTSGTHDQTLNGAFDIFVAKLSSDGTQLLASTFIGGTADDGVNGNAGFTTDGVTKFNYGDDARGEVIVDGANNVYVAAQTFSPNFPTTGGVVQGAPGGLQDGVIFKMTSGLNLTWSTYFGGSGADAAYTLKLDDQGNIIFAGGTASANLPTTGGAYATSYQGGSADGFAGILNSTATNLNALTYLGTPDYDQIYLLDVDEDFDVYVSGQTRGSFPIVNPVAGSVYQETGGKQFITKFNAGLTALEYSTIFGSNDPDPNISPTAFLVDRCENVYVTGWGGTTNTQGSTNGMNVTFDAFQGTTDGSDFYLYVLDRDAQNRLYASFFGGNGVTASGEHVDGGTSRFDKNGIVYHAVCAQCGNPGVPFPTTPNVYSPNTGYPDNCNLAIFKLSFDLAGIEAAFLPRDEFDNVIFQSEGCAPFQVHFDNTSDGNDPLSTTYLWDFDDNGNTSNQFEPIYTFQTPGTYEVQLIITDSTTCNIADTVSRIITVFEAPDVDAGPDRIVCAGDTFQLNGTTDPGNQLAWEPAAAFFTANDIPNPSGIAINSTNFSLTVTDDNGCEATDNVLINVDASFQITAEPDTLICQGGTVGLRSTDNGGISYQWTALPNATLSTPTQANTQAISIDTTTTFIIESLNLNGCRARDTIEVEVFEVFTLEDTFVCDGNSIVLQSSGGESFSWTPNDGSLDDPNLASPTASPLNTTTYTVTATSSEGCVSVKDILVEVQPLPTADAGPDLTICRGFGLPLQGSGGLSYQWTPGTGLSDPTIANPIASPNNSTTYTLSVFDAFGCEDQDQVEVLVNDLPPVMAGPASTTICEGDVLQLSASGALSYQWTPAAGLDDPTSDSPLATPGISTTYVVTGIDGNGCEASDSLTLTIAPRPNTRIEGVNKTCLGGSIELTAFGGDRYLWSTGDTTQMIEVNPQNSTTYYVTAFIGDCEGIQDSITVDVFFDFPDASFIPDTTFAYAPATINFLNTTTGAASYEWDFGFGRNSTAENPSHVFPAAGEYQVQLIAYSENGCADTAIVVIDIDNVTLHVPSGFTPNGDDINDDFLVGYVGIRSLNVQIFSRWGMKIYEEDNKDFRWDGTYDGQPSPEGVYVYVIRGIGENGLDYVRSGTVTLIR
ncbi:MAG: PKD domain-containing protein [Bacteroidota bacterium]